MPPRSDNRPIAARLTVSEEAALRRERERRGAPSLSAVFEQAVLALLEQSDFGREGLRLPSRCGGRMVARAYQVSPRTLRLIDEAAARHGYAIRDILRAAVDKLAREAAQDADG